MIKLILLVLLTSCQTATDNEQSPNDLTAKGIKGEVKYLKSIIDSSVEETYYSKKGFKDSVIYEDGNFRTVDLFRRDERGRILEEIGYENDSLISHYFFTYSNNFSTAEISDKSGKIGHIELNSEGLEIYRSIKTQKRDRFYDLEFYYTYNDINQLIEKKLIIDFGESGHLDTTITEYSFNDQNLISSYDIINLNNYSDKRKIENQINFDFKEFDKEGNWIQANVKSKDQDYSVLREIKYYD